MTQEEIVNLVQNDRFAEYVGIKIIKAEPGYAITEMEINEKHMNGVNIVQGGVIFTLADYAFAVAANTKGIITIGINANISYFKSPKGKVITAEATEVSSQKRLCSYNVDVFDENRELVARFSATGYKKG